MSVYDDVLEAVAGVAQPGKPLRQGHLGPLPPDSGIAIAWSAGNLNTFLDKKAAVSMSAVLNAKHSDQRKAADALGNIHTALNRAKAYPQTDSFQITNIETIGAPRLSGAGTKPAMAVWLEPGDSIFSERGLNKWQLTACSLCTT